MPFAWLQSIQPYLVKYIREKCQINTTKFLHPRIMEIRYSKNIVFCSCPVQWTTVDGDQPGAVTPVPVVDCAYQAVTAERVPDVRLLSSSSLPSLGSALCPAAGWSCPCDGRPIRRLQGSAVAPALCSVAVLSTSHSATSTHTSNILTNC